MADNYLGQGQYMQPDFNTAAYFTPTTTAIINAARANQSAGAVNTVQNFVPSTPAQATPQPQQRRARNRSAQQNPPVPNPPQQPTPQPAAQTAPQPSQKRPAAPRTRKRWTDPPPLSQSGAPTVPPAPVPTTVPNTPGVPNTSTARPTPQVHSTPAPRAARPTPAARSTPNAANANARTVAAAAPTSNTPQGVPQTVPTPAQPQAQSQQYTNAGAPGTVQTADGLTFPMACRGPSSMPIGRPIEDVDDFGGARPGKPAYHNAPALAADGSGRGAGTIDSGDGPSLMIGPYDTRDQAFHSAQEYAIAQGYFLTIKGSTRKRVTKKGDSNYEGTVRVELICSRAGVTESTSRGIRKRLSNRTNCGCKLRLTYSERRGSKWYIRPIEERHNHPLTPGPGMNENAGYRRYRRLQQGGPSLETYRARYSRMKDEKGPEPPKVPDPPAFHRPPQAASTRPTPKGPLHTAVHKGQGKIAQLLLDKGADVNGPDPTGQSPMTCAVDGRQLAMVKMLVERGAEISRRDNRGISPLSLAIDRGFEEIAVYLMENGADPNI